MITYFSDQVCLVLIKLKYNMDLPRICVMPHYAYTIMRRLLSTFTNFKEKFLIHVVLRSYWVSISAVLLLFPLVSDNKLLCPKGCVHS